MAATPERRRRCRRVPAAMLAATLRWGVGAASGQIVAPEGGERSPAPRQAHNRGRCTDAPLGGSCVLGESAGGKDVYTCCLRAGVSPLGGGLDTDKAILHGVSSHPVSDVQGVNAAVGGGARAVRAEGAYGFRVESLFAAPGDDHLLVPSTDVGGRGGAGGGQLFAGLEGLDVDVEVDSRAEATAGLDDHVGVVFAVPEGADVIVRHMCRRPGGKMEVCDLMFESQAGGGDELGKVWLTRDARWITYPFRKLPQVDSLFPPLGSPRSGVRVQVFRADPSGPNAKKRHKVVDPRVAMLHARVEGALESPRLLHVQMLSSVSVAGLSDEHGIDWWGYVKTGPRGFSAYVVRGGWVGVYCGGCEEGELVVDGHKADEAYRLPTVGIARPRFMDKTESLGAPLDPQESIGSIMPFRQVPGAPYLLVNKWHHLLPYADRPLYRYDNESDSLVVERWGDVFGVERQNDKADLHCLNQVDLDLDGAADMFVCLGGGMGKGPIDISTGNLLFTSHGCDQPLCGGPRTAELFNVGHFGAREYGMTLVAREGSNLLDVYLRSLRRVIKPDVPSQLMRRLQGWKGAVPYEDALGETPLPEYASTGALSVDLTGDGQAELVVGSDLENALYIYEPAHGYRKLMKAPGVMKWNKCALGILAMDLDGDLNLDLMILADSRPWEWKPGELPLFFLRNPGTGRAPTWDWETRVSMAPRIMGLSQGIGCKMTGIGKGDMNNDGLEDMLVACSYTSFNSHILLLNRGHDAGGPLFEAVEHAGGLRKEWDAGSSLTVVDYNRDGRLDVALSHGPVAGEDIFYFPDKLEDPPVTFYENQFAPKSNNWVALDLLPTESNEQALGARVVLTLSNGDQQVRSVEDSSGSQGVEDNLGRRLHFGLGGESVSLVSITWPAGGTQTVGGPGGDPGSGLGWRNELVVIQEGFGRVS